MTKKHFEAIAATLKHRTEWADNDEQKQGVIDSALALATTFEEFNERFDRDKFLTACGF